MSKSIFISCVFEDRHCIPIISKWAENKRLGDVVITYEVEDKRPEGADAIKQFLKNKIKGAAVVMVLIGQDTHNHDWIRAETELANSFNIKIICVRIPDAKGNITTGAVPPILVNKPLITFQPESIKSAIEAP